MGRAETIEQRVERRAPKLLEVAQRLVDSEALPAKTILFRPRRIPFVVSAYFLLNAAYKDWRIEDGHRTEKAKIAALQCLAIMTIPSFKPLDPDNVTTNAEALCNELFAVASASVVLGVDIQATRNANFNLRLLDIIGECRSETLEPYVVDLEHKIDRELSGYRLGVLPADKLKINSLVTIFELLQPAS